MGMQSYVLTNKIKNTKLYHIGKYMKLIGNEDT